jgi:hypothetical protein
VGTVLKITRKSQGALWNYFLHFFYIVISNGLAGLVGKAVSGKNLTPCAFQAMSFLLAQVG